MRSYERSGVHIDQCADCRGVFLDRGELDHLIDSESAYYRAAPAPVGAAGYDDRRYGDRRHDLPYDRGGFDRHYRKKKGGFLGDLFD
jgi:hypothetical protein